MNWIKNIWTNITTAFSCLGIVGRIRKLADTFPGVDDQEKLRLWIIESAAQFVPVVAKTTTVIDDKIVDWIQRIALNERAFAAIYHLALLAYEKITPDGNEALYGGGAMVCYSEAIAEALAEHIEASPGDAISVIMAIGMIMQVIRLIREIKKQRGELSIR